MSADKRHVNIDVDGFRRAFLGNIQRLQDHVRACYGGLRHLTTRAYAEATPDYVFVIAPNAMLDLEHAREFSLQWLARSFFRDVIDQVNTYLDHCFDKALVASVVTRQPGACKDEPEARRRFRDFKKLGLPVKLERLEQDFALKSDVAEHIVTVNAVRNCLVHRLGVVRSEDVGEDGTLQLRLRRSRLHITDAKTGFSGPAEFGRFYEDATARTVVDDSLRSFPLGEHIVFEVEELFDCVHTVALFDASMGNSFVALAQRFGLKTNPPTA